jgi:peptide/nickel transport system permease protein
VTNGRRLGWLPRDPATLLAAAVLLLIVLGALFAPLLTPYDPVSQAAGDRFQPVSLAHPLGTDALSRDTFARILYGGRSMLGVTLVSVILALVAGALLGMVAGYRGGAVETWILRAMDVMLSFPLILLAITIVVALGQGILNLTIAIGVSQIPPFTLLARSLVLSIRSREFVLAAHCLGADDRRIIGTHIFPNILTPLVVQSTATMAVAMLQAGALNFLGFGIQPPQPDWGAMVADAKRYVYDRPELPMYPGLAITITAVCLSLLGDGLVKVLDPTWRKMTRS